MIFQPPTTRVSMQGIIDHPWITSYGKLRSIHDASPVRAIDEQLLTDCVELGLPRAELEESLMTGRNNMLAATYRMLEARQETVKRRRGSIALFGSSSGKVVPDSPSSVRVCNSRPEPSVSPGRHQCTIA